MAARYQSLQRDKPRAADFQEDRGMQAGPGPDEVTQGYAAVAQVPARVAFRRAGRMSVGRAQLLNVLEMTLEPLVLVLSLWGVALLIEGQLRAPNMILALIVFSLTFPSEARLSQPARRAIRNLLLGWLALSGLLLLFGYVSDLLQYFDRRTLVAWWWVALACQVGSMLLLRWIAPAVRELEGARKRAVLAGMNEPGVELARRLNADRYSSIHVVGFVDDRARDRLPGIDDFSVLGSIQELPEFVKKNRIELVYLALPMASQPRILSLLESLRDTTASVYFVPDMFVTDLIQGRIDSVSGMPIVGVCDTPFPASTAWSSTGATSCWRSSSSH